MKLQKNKSGQETAKAFEEILKNSNGRKPKNIQVDEGNEFMNAQFKSLCRRNNINLYNENSDKKACVVERFTRTLKDKMWRYGQLWRLFEMARKKIAVLRSKDEEKITNTIINNNNIYTRDMDVSE